MGTKVNKTAIGAFVLGAIVLLVAGVLVLGAGKFLTKEHTYITYFDGSVKGLSVGSPVTFRGVKVGSVTSITISVDQTQRVLKIPVVFNLEPEQFRGAKSEFQRDPKTIENAVKIMGLRTQLQSQSFVTGQLMVALDFFPGTPANFVGWSKEYPEIPSVPTPLEQLQKRLESLPFKEIVENLNSTMREIEKLVKSIDMKKTTALLESGLHDLQVLIRHVDNRVDPLVASLSSTSGTAQDTLKEANVTIVAARNNMDKLMASTDELMATTKTTLEAAQSTLKQSEQTLGSYSEGSQLQAQMNRTLRELNSTLRALRRLSDSLERHPESVLRGKRSPKE